MSLECGPWRSCDFHQYRSWLRKTDGSPSRTTPPDKERQKTKKLRRRPLPGEYQLTFRHHSDPAEYERDYLTQVTHARCRAVNPSATLLATELTSARPSASTSDRTAVALLAPHLSPASSESRSTSATGPAAGAGARAAAGAGVRPVLDTASSPDLSADSVTASPRPTPPTSSPDLCHLPAILVGPRTHRRRSLPPFSVAALPGGAATTSATTCRKPAGQLAGQPAARQARSVSVQRDEGDPTATSSGGGGGGGALRSRRQPSRQPSTPHTVTLDLPRPPGFGCTAQARRNSYRPRGLTKIQLASTVPENLTIIVGRKLEISLSGAKKGRQRGRGFR